MCASKEKLFLKEFDHLYAAATYFLYKSVPNHLVYTPKSWLKVSANVNWDKLWRYKPFLSHLTANFCMKKFVFFFLTFSPLFPSFFFTKILLYMTWKVTKSFVTDLAWILFYLTMVWEIQNSFFLLFYHLSVFGKAFL